MCIDPQVMIKHLWRKILDIIAEDTGGVLICGGDWKIQFQQSLDSTNLTERNNPEKVTVKKLLLEAAMMDVWRELNPTMRQFTFFSHPHNVHSRADYFLMFHSERHKIFKCQIGVKYISDHAGVYPSVAYPGYFYWGGQDGTQS